MEPHQDSDSPAKGTSASSSPEEKSKEIVHQINKIIAKAVEHPDTRTTNLLQDEIEDSASHTSQEGGAGVEKPLPEWLRRFNIWHRSVMSDYVFMMWLAVVVGLFSGFAAHIFNRLISISSNIFTRIIENGRVNWWLVLVPIGGIVLSGIYTRYVVRTDLTHGVTRLMHSIYRGEFLLKRNLIYSPILGGTLTLGMGGSAGSEGPIAISGAAIGSNLGRWLELKMPLVKVLVGCGAAAGISGIFQSPVGGILFTLEFLKMEIGTLSILAVTLSSLVAYGIVFVCNGCEVPTQFLPEETLQPEQYWAVLLMGLLCGFYSLYYTMAINKTDKIFINIKNPWIRNMGGGLVIGVSLLLFPALYGVGYPVMSDVIHSKFTALSDGDVLTGMHLGNWGLIIVAVCILGIKCWACGACNASGGVSSDFAPTLFAGAIAGFLFSMFSNTALHTHLPVEVFTLLGMAAVMSGCIEAPMMTIFIVANMGIDINFLLAIIIASYMSYIVVRICSRLRGYDNKIVRHIEWFKVWRGHANKTSEFSAS